jgi:hypothetical protein
MDGCSKLSGYLPRIPKVKAQVCCSMLRKAISIFLLTRYGGDPFSSCSVGGSGEI